MPMRLKDQATAYASGDALKPKGGPDSSSPGSTSVGAPSNGASNSPGALVGNEVIVQNNIYTPRSLNIDLSMYDLHCIDYFKMKINYMSYIIYI